MGAALTNPDRIAPEGLAFLDHAAPGETPIAFAQRVRVEAFETAWREAGEASDESRWLTGPLEDELELRRAWWLRGEGGAPAEARDRSGPLSRRMGLEWLTLAGLVVMASFAFSMSALVGIVVVVAGLGMVGRRPLGEIVRSVRVRRWRQRMSDRVCPFCGHDLSVDPTVCGPARCPSCGAPWPLIPPAVRLAGGGSGATGPGTP